MRPTQRGCITPCGTPFSSKIDVGARTSLSSPHGAAEPPQAACSRPQHPCCECRQPGPLSLLMMGLRSDARSRAEQQEGARRAVVGKHVGQNREGMHDVPERAAGILVDSLDRCEATMMVRACTCVTAWHQTCLRDPTFDAVSWMHQALHRRLQGGLAWRAGVQGRRRHLLIAQVHASRDVCMRTVALALWTFLRDTRPTTHHGEPRGILKVGWCCRMYMQIFQSVSGSPCHHRQLMPALAQQRRRAHISSTFVFPQLTLKYMRVWYCRT